MKKRSVALVLTTCLMGLAGCSGNQKNNATDTVKRNFNATTTNNQNGMILNDTNQKLRISTRASNSVERMKAVDQAHVIIRNNNAYVAVRLKNNGNRAGIGTDGTGTNVIDGNGTNAGTTGATGTSNNSNNTGMYGNGYNSGATGTTGVDGNGNNAGVSGIGGTGNISGITGSNGAGTNANTYTEISSPLEQKIADRVHAADKNIHNVYVSVNPDFYTQMTTYSNNISTGQNRDGLWNDFSNTVRRFFK
jgi:hypothetical protein